MLTLSRITPEQHADKRREYLRRYRKRRSEADAKLRVTMRELYERLGIECAPKKLD